MSIALNKTMTYLNAIPRGQKYGIKVYFIAYLKMGVVVVYD